MGKIAAAGSAIKNAKLPSPGEIKDGYLNSAFHKSLHQPLMVKTKVEKTDVQQARQAMTQVKYQQSNVVVSYVHCVLQDKTPLQLGNIESISDIPIPTVRKSKHNPDADSPQESKTELTMPKNMDELGKTILPKSFFEQNIVTAVKENVDPEVLESRRNLTLTKSPAQLAEINSLADIPVPGKIKNLLNSSGEKNEVAIKKRRYD